MKLIGKLLIGLVLVPTIGYGQNYFKEGTIWYENSYYLNEVRVKSTLWLEKTENANPDEDNANVYVLKRYVQYVNSDFPGYLEDYCLIKTEGEKIFFQSFDDDDSDWYLMYDFGIQPKEKNTFYNPEYEEYGVFFHAELKCEEITPSNPEYYNWETISLAARFPLIGFESVRHIWIKGLGSTFGIFGDWFHDVYAWTGDGYSMLESVSYEGETIYGIEVNAIESVETDNPLVISVEGSRLIVSNATMGETVTLYSPNGRVLSQTKVHSDPTVLAAPGKGPFIIKVGSEAQKVIGN